MINPSKRHKTLKKGGFFFTADQRAKTSQFLQDKSSAVGNTVTGAFATGMLNMLLRADESYLNMLKGSAITMARRQTQNGDIAKVEKAKSYLTKLNQYVSEGLTEGERQGNLNKVPAQLPAGGTRRRKRIY